MRETPAVSAAPADLRRAVYRDAASIGVAVGAYGVSFGAVAVAAGLSVPQACALSLLAFTGASQFALVGVLGAGGGALAGTATALLLGSRNTLYALRLATLLGVRGGRRLLGAHLVIDETTAMALARADPAESRLAFWATGAAVYTCWNAATLIGALGARYVGDPRTLGLDAAFPAAFLALLAPRLRSARPVAVAAVATGVAVVAVPFVPAGVPVLLAALVAVIAGGRG